MLVYNETTYEQEEFIVHNDFKLSTISSSRIFRNRAALAYLFNGKSFTRNPWIQDGDVCLKSRSWRSIILEGVMNVVQKPQQVQNKWPFPLVPSYAVDPSLSPGPNVPPTLSR